MKTLLGTDRPLIIPVFSRIFSIGQFFVPFFGLITPRTKKTPLNLAKMAGWILVVHVIDVWQLIIPSLPDRGPKGPLTAGIRQLLERRHVDRMLHSRESIARASAVPARAGSRAARSSAG